MEEIPCGRIKTIINGAKSRNLEYSLSNEFLWNLYIAQNRKCALSGRKIYFSHDTNDNTASLDRIDSKVGYREDNVQWVHKHINIVKNKFDQDYFLKVCQDIYECNKNKILEVKPPSWCDYFLGIAQVVAQKSKDAQTKCGAVLVDDNNHIVATGYNSFPRGMPDEILPNIRPDKYDLIIHAERQALFNTNSNIWSYQNGLTMYITMPPCFDCLKTMINSNISTIYAVDIPLSPKFSEQKKYFDFMLHASNINYMLVEPDFSWMNNIKVGD